MRARDLWRMRAFYLAYPASEVNLPQLVADLATRFLPQAVAEIPWGHNTAIIEKVKDPQQRLWYAQQTIEHGWSCAVIAQLPSVKIVFPMHYYVEDITPWPDIASLSEFTLVADAMYEVVEQETHRVVIDSNALPESVEVWVLDYLK